MMNEQRSPTAPVGTVVPLVSPARHEVRWQPLGTSRDAYLAHAALVLKSRRQHESVEWAVEYLHEVADVIGVDCVELASLIVVSSERRATSGHGATA